jgi:hypothetical protein
MNARLFFAAVCMVAAALASHAQVVSFSTQTYPTSAVPRRVAWGDITGDGKFDLVSFEPINFGLSLFRNENFDFTFYTNTNGFFNPLRTYLTDFDNDGRADYVIGEPGNGTINKSFPDGTPYAASVGFAPGGKISLGDLNLDGLIDIVAEDGGIWFNTGGFTIAASEGFYYSGSSKGSQVADVNQDARPDVIVHHDGFDTGDIVYVAVIEPDGTYSDDPPLAIETADLDEIRVVDVNTDGLPDIIGLSADRRTFEVRLNLFNALFGAPQIYSTSGSPKEIVVGNFAASSGNKSVAVLCDNGTLEIWVNNGTGYLTGPARVSVGVGAVHIAAADYNADARDDIAVVNEIDSTLTVLTNTTPQVVSVLGTVTFQARNPSAALPTTTVVARNADGAEVFSTLSADGTFALLVPRGEWDIRVRAADFYLSSSVSVNTGSGSVSGVSVLMRTGDVNRDNAVDIADLLPLIAHYNRFGITNGVSWLPEADFNGDQWNDITDLLLLIGNFNQMGN